MGVKVAVRFEINPRHSDGLEFHNTSADGPVLRVSLGFEYSEEQQAGLHFAAECVHLLGWY